MLCSLEVKICGHKDTSSILCVHFMHFVHKMHNVLRTSRHLYVYTLCIMSNGPQCLRFIAISLTFTHNIPRYWFQYRVWAYVRINWKLNFLLISLSTGHIKWTIYAVLRKIGNQMRIQHLSDSARIRVTVVHLTVVWRCHSDMWEKATEVLRDTWN
jgi:hypothetical protein